MEGIAREIGIRVVATVLAMLIVIGLLEFAARMMPKKQPQVKKPCGCEEPGTVYDQEQSQPSTGTAVFSLGGMMGVGEPTEDFKISMG